MLNPHPTLRFADLRPSRYRDPARRLRDPQRLILTYNARVALYQLFRALPVGNRRKDVLLPAFHCTTVVEPIVRAGYRPIYYRIRPDLTVDYEDVIEKSRRGVAAVLVIHYCGFPIDLAPLLAERRAADNWFLIEDWAHSFLDAATFQLRDCVADFAVFSFYKLLPTIVGGALRINAEGFPLRIATQSVSARQGLVIAKRMLEQAIENSPADGVKRVLGTLERLRVERKRRAPGRAYLSDTESQFPDTLRGARMPWLARWIFGTCDLRHAVTMRRKNYLSWASHLIERDSLDMLFPQLPPDVCPWAFPVRLRDRSQWDIRLRELDVPLFTFGETLHPSVQESDGTVLKDALRLSQQTLMLGVHQGLTSKHIHRAADTVNRSFTGLKQRRSRCVSNAS